MCSTKWYLTVVTGVLPQFTSEEESEVEEEKAALVALPALAFDKVQAAESVYAEVMRASSYDEATWTVGQDASVLEHYMRMNLHYYCQKSKFIHLLSRCLYIMLD